METNKIEYAFPLLDDLTNSIQNGMTLRDYFAGLAMQGIATKYGSVNSQSHAEKWADSSYILADAMLKQRKL